MHHKFGFNKKLHMGALAQYKREEGKSKPSAVVVALMEFAVANKASKSMKYFKKVTLAMCDPVDR